MTETPKNRMRLSKTMAHRGLCSRREAEYYIRMGWVKINGQIVLEKGTPIAPEDHITLSEPAHRRQAERVTILLNKPVGFVSAQPEKGYKAAVSLITPGHQWRQDKSGISYHPQHVFGLAPAGRLDIDSTGLLVLTQDGRIARTLIGADSQTEKEYLVRVTGTMAPNGLKLLQQGLTLDGEKLRPAEVRWQNKEQLRFILRQGKKRQIRRMCALVGLKVIGLKRIRIGNIRLGQLPAGQWRYLGKNERFQSAAARSSDLF